MRPLRLSLAALAILTILLAAASFPRDAPVRTPEPEAARMPDPPFALPEREGEAPAATVPDAAFEEGDAFSASADEEETSQAVEDVEADLPPEISAATESPAAPPAPLDEGPRVPALTKVAGDLGHAVGLVPHPLLADAYFVLRHDGSILLLAPEGAAQEALDLKERVRAAGEAGLHSLAFHPYDPHRAFVFSNEPDTSLVLAELRLASDLRTLAWENERLRVPPAYGGHNGGALAFGPDGYLYVSVGDGGLQDDPDGRAQDLGSLHGKILRIDVDAPGAGHAIPPDNPFVGVEGARPQVWALGFRNPWRMAFAAAQGDLWVADVGGSIAEEINHHPASRPAGANYGWRVFEGATRRHPDEVGPTIPPVHEYRPTAGRCAVTGGLLYRGPMRELDGQYVFADFCDGKVRALARDAEGGWSAREIMKAAGGVVHLVPDRDGTLLVLTYAGSLYQLAYVPA